MSMSIHEHSDVQQARPSTHWTLKRVVQKDEFVHSRLSLTSGGVCRGCPVGSYPGPDWWSLCSEPEQ